MSKFTRQYDFYDFCNMHNKPEEILGYKIYVNDKLVPSNAVVDLVPYYTHLVMFAETSSKVVYLSGKSAIDYDEQQYIAMHLFHIIRAARKAKRERKTFDADYCIANYASFNNDRQLLEESIFIIKQHPKILQLTTKSFFESIANIKEAIPKYFKNMHIAKFDNMRAEFLQYAKNYA